jgi:arylsulfatase A-like enzyme
MFIFLLFNHDNNDSPLPKKQLRPNVLFISIDDLNDWVGCLKGHPQVRTPNIDRLAATGTLFTNAHTQSPICNPSRTSVLTGYRPSSTGIYGLSPWIREVESLKDIVTLPQYFKRQGYQTFSGGKIYHGGYGRMGSDKEFDSLGPPAGVKTSPPTKLAGVTPGGNNPWVDWGSFPLKDQELQDWEIASWASELLSGDQSTPFFLSVGFFLPHVPLYAPADYFDLYPEDKLIMPEIRKNDREDTPKASWYNHWDVPEPRWKWFQENHQDTLFVRSYLAAISYMDQQVGRVLDALENGNYNDNTVVVLWSDHGFHLGEKEISGKNTLWERSTRVPLIFAGKEIGVGKTVDEPAELLDIYPTLIDLCGLPEKGDLEGHSLLPQLKNHKTRRVWPAITTNNHDNHAVRTESWRYIRYADGSEELYNMATDPNEWNNLANIRAYKDIKDSLLKWIPKRNKEPLVGNYQRILEYRENTPIWQGNLIKKSDTIPGI